MGQKILNEATTPVTVAFQSDSASVGDSLELVTHTSGAGRVNLPAISDLPQTFSQTVKIAQTLSTSGAVSVYPATGDSINGKPTGSGIVIPSGLGLTVTFTPAGANLWEANAGATSLSQV